MIPKYRCRRCGHEREDLAQMLAAVQNFHLVTFCPAKDLETLDNLDLLCGEGCAAKHLSEQVAGWRAA